MNYDFGKITFAQEYEDGQSVVHTIRGDASLDDVIEAFESFLKGAGYHLRDGQHIGYEYDDEPSYQDRKEMYDDMITGSMIDDVAHSEYYWDTERNK